MPPALLMICIGRQRKLPLPLVILWPFAFVAWFVLIILRLAFIEDREFTDRWMAARTVLYGLANLSGLRIDMRSSDGSGIHLWII